jgi:hypothetical protein
MAVLLMLLKRLIMKAAATIRRKWQQCAFRRKELLVKTALLAGYVQSASGGDTEIILSSGFDIVRPGNGLPEVTQVFNLRLKTARAEGSMRARWNKVRGAKVYLVRVLLDMDKPDEAELKATPSACFCTITGLLPGTRYHVQVAAIGGGKIGDWSNPAAKYAE